MWDQNRKFRRIKTQHIKKYQKYKKNRGEPKCPTPPWKYIFRLIILVGVQTFPTQHTKSNPHRGAVSSESPTGSPHLPVPLGAAKVLYALTCSPTEPLNTLSLIIPFMEFPNGFFHILFFQVVIQREKILMIIDTVVKRLTINTKDFSIFFWK